MLSWFSEGIPRRHNSHQLKYNVLLMMISYLIMTKIKLYKYFTKYLLNLINININSISYVPSI